MSKISIEEVKQALEEAKVEKDKIFQITKNLEIAAEEAKLVKQSDGEPKKKNEFLVVLPMFDPNLKPEDYTAYVFTQKEGEDSGLLLSRVSDAARSYNETKKGNKYPFTSLIEVFGHLKRKFYKNVQGGINLKTKEAVRVIVLKKDNLV